MIEAIGMINNVSVYSAKGCILVTDFVESQDYALIIGGLALATILFMFSAIVIQMEYDKRKRFMVKNKLENSFQEWKHDRRAD